MTAPRLAALTIVQDEQEFLPHWLRYYGRQVGAEHCYVLDHETKDGSTDGVPNCIHVEHPDHMSFDHAWLEATVAEKVREVLASYDAVVVTEVDEFLLPNPAQWPTLGVYAEAHPDPVRRATGLDVVHVAAQPSLRWETPWLAQRRFWTRARMWDKTLLTRVPLRWTVGFHEVVSGADVVAPDPDLWLVHCHRIDVGVCLRRHTRRQSRPWNPADLAQRSGWQNRLGLEDLGAFCQWFYAMESRPVQIPPAAWGTLP